MNESSLRSFLNVLKNVKSNSMNYLLLFGIIGKDNKKGEDKYGTV
ncbi:hypothetical protein FH5_04215 [Priestia endophytica]|nr:hypothetical protein FH5_04215 [Priestia endophytica]